MTVSDRLQRAKNGDMRVRPELRRERAGAKSLAKRARAENTLRAYASDMKKFETWCRSRRVELPASPEDVGAYISFLREQGRKASTISRALTAINQSYRLSKLDPPGRSAEVSETMKGLRRVAGTAPSKKTALEAHILRRLCEALPDTLRGKRDHALLLIGWNLAARRSALMGVCVEHIVHKRDYSLVTIVKDKTDQERKGRTLPIHKHHETILCPVIALKTWLLAAGIKSGPIFRRASGGTVGAKALHPHSVGKIVKRAAERAGLQPREFGGHSLRSGVITSAARAGRSIDQIKALSGHRSIKTLLEYIQFANVDKIEAAKGLE